MNKVMRRFAVVAGLAALGLVAYPAAQEPAPSSQVFRTGVDLIRIDVTVLDKDRHPVRGLTAQDFTVRENGRPQRIVAVSEMTAADASPTQTAWMRYAPRDVASNDIADQLGDGQAVAIVLDDFAIPDDSTEMAISTREIARYIVNSLGPSDVAAVVFPDKPGRTQDFTHDRTLLLAAIDKFEAEQPFIRVLQPRLPGGIEGDVQRYSPVLGRDPCLQVQPVIPTLRSVTSRLASVPNRRKALFFVSVGLPIQFRPGNSRCQGIIYDAMRKTFETAQRYNVNIHSIDPGGAAGYQRYLQQQHVRNQRMTQPMPLICNPVADRAGCQGAVEFVRVRHDFLETLGEQTGGRPVVDSDDLEKGIAEIFDEYGSYYLIGYEASNPDADGKFRTLDVQVNRPGVEVRTRNGRWAPDKKALVADNRPGAHICVLDCYTDQPTAAEVQLTGMMPNQPLKVRGAVYPVARAGSTGEVEMAAVLTIRLPALVRQADEALTIIRTAYDADGRGSLPVQEKVARTLTPGLGDDTTYDVWSQFPLAPGRHKIRFNATSRIADGSGTALVEVEVPDLSKVSAAASSIVLGTVPEKPADNPLSALLPIVPTTSRDFTKGERITAFMRIFSGTAAPGAVEVSGRIVGTDETHVVEIPTATIPADVFEEQRSAAYRFDLPLPQLESGLHLLSLTAKFENAQLIRRDIVFRVR